MFDDQRQLCMLEAAFETAFDNKDVGTLMAVYAPETRAFAAIRGSPRFTISDLDVHVSGNIRDVACSTFRPCAKDEKMGRLQRARDRRLWADRFFDLA